MQTVIDEFRDGIDLLLAFFVLDAEDALFAVADDHLYQQRLLPLVMNLALSCLGHKALDGLLLLGLYAGFFQGFSRSASAYPFPLLGLFLQIGSYLLVHGVKDELFFQ